MIGVAVDTMGTNAGDITWQMLKFQPWKLERRHAMTSHGHPERFDYTCQGDRSHNTDLISLLQIHWSEVTLGTS